MIVSVDAWAIGVLAVAVVVAVGSPSAACLPDGGTSVQPRPAFQFAGRSAGDPVHSMSLLIMTGPALSPVGCGRSWMVCNDQHGLRRTSRVDIVGSFQSVRGLIGSDQEPSGPAAVGPYPVRWCGVAETEGLVQERPQQDEARPPHVTGRSPPVPD